MFRRKLIKFRLLFINPSKRADLLRRTKYFSHIGDNIWYTPVTIPTEGDMISIGNNTVIASGVVLVTHDEIARVLSASDNFEHNYSHNIGRISIGNNVFVGQNALILPGVSIGDNVVVAAGAVVQRDVPSGEIVGGVPARCIGYTEELKKKRRINM